MCLSVCVCRIDWAEPNAWGKSWESVHTWVFQSEINVDANATVSMKLACENVTVNKHIQMDVCVCEFALWLLCVYSLVRKLCIVKLFSLFLRKTNVRSHV